MKSVVVRIRYIYPLIVDPVIANHLIEYRGKDCDLKICDRYSAPTSDQGSRGRPSFNPLMNVVDDSVVLRPAGQYHKCDVTIATPYPRPRNIDDGPAIKRAQLFRRFHIRSNGICAIVFELVFGRGSLSTAEAIAFSNAAENMNSHLSTKKDGSGIEKESLWKLKEEYRSVGKWTAFALLYQAHIEVIRANTRDSSKNAKELSGGMSNPSQDEIAVNPSVLTILQYGNHTEYKKALPYNYDDGMSLPGNYENQERRISALLYRWKTSTSDGWQDVERNYSETASTSLCHTRNNMNVHRDVYLANSLQSCLMMCNMSRTSADGHLLYYLSNSAVEKVIVNDRVLWYALLMLNIVIDSDVDELEDVASVQVNDVLRRLARRKLMYLRIMSATSEHNIISDSLLLLHRDNERILGIRQLQDHAFGKLAVLEELVSLVRQLRIYDQVTRQDS